MAGVEVSLPRWDLRGWRFARWPVVGVQTRLSPQSSFRGDKIIPLAEAGAEMRKILNEIKADYPDLQYSVDTSGYGALTGGNSDYLSNNITLEVSGAEPREISAYTDRIVERLRKESGFVEVASSSRETQPVILLDVNRTRALMGGLTVGQIGLGVRTGMFGSTVTYVERDGELIPVIVRPASEGVPSLETVLEMPVTSAISAGVFWRGERPRKQCFGGCADCLELDTTMLARLMRFWSAEW